MSKLPGLILKNMVLLPNNELRLELVTDIDKEIISLAESYYNKNILLLFQKDDLDINCNNYPDVGVIGFISMKLDMPNKKTRVIINGLERVNIKNLFIEEDLLFGEVCEPVNKDLEYFEEAAYKRSIFKSLDDFISCNEVNSDISSKVNDKQSLDVIIDILAMELNLSLDRLDGYLNEVDVSNRALMILDDLSLENKIAELELSINEKVSHNIDEAQKEYILGEKLKVIKEELGESNSEIDEIKHKIDVIKAPKRVKDKLYKELEKYQNTSSASPDYSMIRTYIDTVLSLPWSYKTVDNKDLTLALHTLNESHYGLEEVKDTILEYLSLFMVAPKNNNPIICLVGPPGVGKTTLAHSIALAMNRKYVKVSVGGVNDTAEIVGHRRAYIGSSPGRIINGMRKAGVINPVFVIDEIDKMTKDIKGDPASSLLEVLDKEQNKHFYDNYIEEEYDLSNVTFICTANYVDRIPIELLDRLEIIELSSYTLYEKINICKNYIIPKLIKSYNIESYNIKFSDDAIIKIIKNYTMEAGVREAYRLIGKILRKIIRNVVSDKKCSFVITALDVTDYLGPIKYNLNESKDKYLCGEVNAMSYTMYGGNILKLEVNLYKGDGKIVTTGSLGDVFKESVMVSLSYIKANSNVLGIDDKIFKNSDIHLHVPEGAIKKDGPSAGCAITIALISALKKSVIPRDISMTGEVTIHGNVLPIGGLKEKIIGAKEFGIKKIFIPKDNKREFSLISDDIKNGIKFIFVSKIDEIIKELNL